jgi:hypothetical protein
MSRTEVVLDRGRVQSGRLPIGAVVYPHFLQGAEARLEPKPSASAAMVLLENTRSFAVNGQQEVTAVARLVRDVFHVSLEFGRPDLAVDLVERASANWWLD